MKNWEMLREKIKALNDDEYLDLVSIISNYRIKKLIGRSKNCNLVEKEKCEETTCNDCMKNFLQEEYEEPKKWIVYRWLRKKGRYTYIGEDDRNTSGHTTKGFYTTFDKAKTTKYSLKKAIDLRDYLNQDRQGRQYIWLIAEEK